MSKTERIPEEIWARYQKATIWNRILSLSGLSTNPHLSWPAIFHPHNQMFGYNSSPLNSFPGFTQRAYELKWPQTSVILIPSLCIKGNGGSEKLSTDGMLSVSIQTDALLLPNGLPDNFVSHSKSLFLPTAVLSYLQVGKPRPPAHVTVATAKGLSHFTYLQENWVLILDPCLWQCFYPIFQFRSVFLLS